NPRSRSGTPSSRSPGPTIHLHGPQDLGLKASGRPPEYLIDREGYGPEELSWVARDNVLDPTLLSDYLTSIMTTRIVLPPVVVAVLGVVLGHRELPLGGGGVVSGIHHSHLHLPHLRLHHPLVHHQNSNHVHLIPISHTLYKDCLPFSSCRVYCSHPMTTAPDLMLILSIELCGSDITGLQKW
ncbi:hypothetical protein M9458_001355, partial [Cirrhinus mrigala]